MAGLRGVEPVGTWGSSPTVARQSTEVQPIPFDYGGGESQIARGIRSSWESAKAGLQGFGAVGLEAAGADQLAQRLYASAAENQQAAEENAPRVGSVRQIAGGDSPWTDTRDYVAGKFGEFLPYLAAGGATGLLGRAGGLAGGLRAGLRGDALAAHAASRAHLASTAAFQPVMAGETALQLREDPAARGMSPLEKAVRSNLVGAGEAAIGAMVPASMTNRLFTPRAAPASLRGAIAGLGEEVGKNSIAGGAGLAAMDVAGQVHRQSYDPNYKYNMEQTGEAFAGGLAGMAPIAAVHAVPAKAGDYVASGTRATKDAAGKIGAGAKFVSKQVYDNMPGGMRAALDAIGDGAGMTSGVYNELTRNADYLTTAGKELLHTVRKSAGEHLAETSDRAAVGEPMTPEEHAARLYETGVKTAATATELGATVRDQISRDHPAVAATLANAFSSGHDKGMEATAEAMTDPAKWVVEGEKMTPEKLKKIQNQMSNPRVAGMFANTVHEFMQRHEVEGQSASELRSLVDRVRSGEDLAPADKARMYSAFKQVKDAKDTVDDFSKIVGHDDRVKAAQDNTGQAVPDQLSRQGDVINKVVRDALKSATTDTELASSIASRIKTSDVARFGAERVVREAVTETVRKYGIDPAADQTFTDMHDKVLEAVKSKVGELEKEGSWGSVQKSQQADANKAALRDRIGEHVDAMLASSPDVGKELASSPKAAKQLKEAILDFASKLASGEKGYNKRAVEMATFLQGKFGEAGKVAVDNIMASASAAATAGIIGKKGATNLQAFRAEGKTLHDTAGGITKLMKNPPKGDDRLAEAGRMKAVSQLLKDVNNAHELEARKSSLRETVEQLNRAAKKAGEEGDAKRQLTLLEQADKAVGLMLESGWEGLKQKWVEEGVVDEKKFDALVEAVEGYSRSDQRLTKPERKVADHATSANHQAENIAKEARKRGDDDLNDPESAQDASAAPDAGAEDPVSQGQVKDMNGKSRDAYLAARREAETGTQGETEAAPIWWGTNAFESGGHNGNVGAPISRHQSGDYPFHNAQYGAALDEAHAKYGQRVTQGRGVRPMAWAEEMANSGGKKSEYEYLDDALRALLKHDKERLASGKLTAEDKHWLNNRAKLADELLAQQERLGGIKNFPAAGHFFAHAMNRGYRYYRMQQHDASNLSFNKEHLQAVYAVREGEAVGAYVKRQRDREGGVFANKVYENSLLPLKDADGKTVTIDVAKLVTDAMARHQSGDITGLGDKTAAVDIRQEILTAFHNVVASLMMADGMHPKDIFGGDGKLHVGEVVKRDVLNKWQEHFDPSLVVFRDPTGRLKQELGEHVKSASVRNFFTVGDLTGIRGVDENGRTQRDTMLDGRNLSPGMLSEADLAGILQKAPAKGAHGETEMDVKSREDAANRGVAYQGVESPNKGKPLNADVHRLLSRMVERNGMDPYEAFNGGNLPVETAGHLLHEAFMELKASGHGGELFDTSSTKFDGLVLYHRSYGDTSFPVTFKDVKGTIAADALAVKTGKPVQPFARNLRDAKIEEALKLLKKAENAEVAAAKRVADGVHTQADTSPAMRKERADAVTAGLEKTEFAKGQPGRVEEHARENADGTNTRYAIDAPTEANKYHPEDTENMRLAKLLREFGEDSGDGAPLFDKSERRLFVDAAKLSEDKQGAGLTPEKSAALEKKLLDILHSDPVAAEASKWEAGREARDKAAEASAGMVVTKPEVRTTIETGKKLSAEGTQPVPLTKEQQIANAKLESTNVRTNEANRLALAKAKREESIAAAKDATAAEIAQQRKATGALREQGRLEKEIKTEAQRSEAPKAAVPKNDFDPFAAVKDMASREASNSTLRETHRLLREMDDTQLRDFLVSLPKQSAVEGTVAGQASKLAATDSGGMMAWAKALRDRAGVEFSKQRGVFQEKTDTPFSRQGLDAAPKPGAVDEGMLHAEMARLTKDAFGLELADVKDKDGNSVAGKFDPEAMKAFVSYLSSDRMGTLHHELWHGVTRLLEGMGAHGEKILGDIQKHVDAPFMKRWLTEKFKEDPGALEQLDTPAERAAYAFQLFMRGEKMPVAEETRGRWQRIKDWVQRVASKLGFETTTASERAGSFFDYVKRGDFARDMGNAPAVRRGLGEKSGDNTMAAAAKVLKPALEGLEVVLQHSDTRVRKLGIPEYNQILEKYSGPSGKGGYNLDRWRNTNKFAYRLEDKIVGMSKEQLDKFSSSADFTQFQREVEAYMREAGVKDGQLKGFYERVDSFSIDAINKNMEEFVNDLVQHGGFGGKAGEARTIANRIADLGYFYDKDVKLFEKRPDIAAKWRSQDFVESAARFIDRATYVAERTRTFGHDDAELKALLAAGDAKAGPDGRRLMANMIAAYEGRLGSDELSPGVKKFMQSMIFVNNVRILPKAVFSQMLEPMQLALRKNSLNGTMTTLLKGISEMPRAFDNVNKMYSPSTWERLSRQIGSAPTRILSSAMANLVSGIPMTGKIGRLNELFFKYTFQDGWNVSMHTEATKHGAEFLMEHADAVRKGQGKHSERFLSALGVSEKDIKANANGELILNNKVERAICQFAQEAMAHPDANSNPLFMNDARFALIAQMKRFTFAHSRYVLERGIDEYKLGNAFPLMPAVLAMPWMVAADSLRDTLTGADTHYKDNWTAMESMEHAFERTGGVGRLQFGADAGHAVQHGADPLVGMLGPTAELFGRIARGAHNGDMINALIANAPGGPLIMPD